MTAHATIHFCLGDEVKAIVYRHLGGDPKRAGASIRQFLADLKARNIDELDNPSLLAARYLVWQTNWFQYSQSKMEINSLGILIEDPQGLEYCYKVDSKVRDENGSPLLSAYKVSQDWQRIYPCPEVDRLEP